MTIAVDHLKDRAQQAGWRPRQHTLELIAAAEQVLADAADAGYRFTLRRVFYALVSSNRLPNTERSYKRLSEVLNEARWNGLLPLDCLDDLGRVADIPLSWRSPAAAVRDAAYWYRSDWWADARPRVEVWAEKAAVAGIVGPVAAEFGVPFLACRGFSSLTALAEAASRLRGRAAVVLYVGDHDPSGLDMDRDLAERLCGLGASVELRRLALTVDQIDDHQLPPQPTKDSDSRARGYSLAHGGSWELDALPADTLAGLVREAVQALAPADFEDRRDADEQARAAIEDLADQLDRLGNDR